MNGRFGFLSFLLFAINGQAQDDQLIVYDAHEFIYSVKTANLSEGDQSLSGKLHYNQTWQLPSPAVFNSTGLSRFSEMEPVAGIMSSEQYPASANVKILAIRGDSSWDRCSGMMVGPKHVLTAAHCVITDVDTWNETKEFVPHLHVKPGFDNGKISKFGVVKVSKVYIFKSYFQGRSRKDLALLELTGSIGNNTGWVNMGFENDRQKILDTRFCNFSYPMDAGRINFPRSFNGDTLYLKAGYPDLVSLDYIGINSTGIPGESGSLLITGGKDGFVALGVRNFSEERFSFYRLKEDDVEAFYSIIHPVTPAGTYGQTFVNSSVPATVSIYPNPVFEKAIITTSSSIEHLDVSFIDLTGKEIFSTSLTGNDGKFLFENSNLPQGSYFMLAKQGNVFLGGIKLVIRK